ncbi:hypothetical protein MNB_SV-9-77 [hydrothermal vent metagenome]|uniref:Uncharacterized protein n=1 Tax=hydrothermal vent metagenome TaxID=652676 RepID=A0A1W1CFP8_9ZZZZ
MRPEEIKPDTALCTILGYNAQTGQSRRYFNKWLKLNRINATAIALNITDEHFHFTMTSVANSKVDKMILEYEFKSKAVEYCEKQDNDSIDFIETEDGKVIGYNLDSKVNELFENLEFIDDRIKFITKMMIIANRWYGVEIDLEQIPLLIEE